MITGAYTESPAKGPGFTGLIKSCKHSGRYSLFSLFR